MKGGCEEIIRSLGLDPSAQSSSEVAWGVTKIFIRHPEIIFSLEEKREQKYGPMQSRYKPSSLFMLEDIVSIMISR
jgi:myosin heavy subunit